MADDTRTAEKALTTVRPNGKVYRRRKPIEAQTVGWNDDGMVVLVYGTHDTNLARAVAQQEWERELDGPLPEPRTIWTKLVPWDALGYGWDRTILDVSGDSKGSTPTLQYGGE